MLILPTTVGSIVVFRHDDGSGPLTLVTTLLAGAITDGKPTHVQWGDAAGDFFEPERILAGDPVVLFEADPSTTGEPELNLGETVEYDGPDCRMVATYAPAYLNNPDHVYVPGHRLDLGADEFGECGWVDVWGNWVSHRALMDSNPSVYSKGARDL